MNNTQPSTSTASNLFDSLLFSSNGSYAVPDTLASAVPETTPDVVEALTKHNTGTLPPLKLPQVAPGRVIAMRQRSLVPVSRLQLSRLQPLDAAPGPQMAKQKLMRQERLSTPPEQSETKLVSQTPQLSLSFQAPQPQCLPNTPTPNNTYYRNLSRLSGITYIPRSMTRHTQPTVVDALIACGTLILLCVCVFLFLYYIGL